MVDDATETTVTTTAGNIDRDRGVRRERFRHDAAAAGRGRNRYDEEEERIDPRNDDDGGHEKEEEDPVVLAAEAAAAIVSDDLPPRRGDGGVCSRGRGQTWTAFLWRCLRRISAPTTTGDIVQCGTT